MRFHKHYHTRVVRSRPTEAELRKLGYIIDIPDEPETLTRP